VATALHSPASAAVNKQRFNGWSQRRGGAARSLEIPPSASQTMFQQGECSAPARHRQSVRERSALSSCTKAAANLLGATARFLSFERKCQSRSSIASSL